MSVEAEVRNRNRVLRIGLIIYLALKAVLKAMRFLCNLVLCQPVQAL